MLQYCPVLYTWSSGKWREESKYIELPYETFAEVPEEFKYIRSIFEFLSKPRQYNLPDTYQDMFVLVRLADFLGCDVFLDFVSSALRVQKKIFFNINSISSVHRLIRNKYRQNKYNSSKFVCDGCFSCISAPPPRKPEIFYSPCCFSPFHFECFSKGTICPGCSTCLLPLCCLFCNNVITDPTLTPLQQYMSPTLRRTKCCSADLHATCYDNIVHLNRCHTVNIYLLTIINYSFFFYM